MPCFRNSQEGNQIYNMCTAQDRCQRYSECEASISHKRSSNWRKEAHCTFYTEGWHINLSTLPRIPPNLRDVKVLLTLQNEGQHLILCPTSSSIFFHIHPIQLRLDEAKWFWRDFQSTRNGSAAINKNRALQQETEQARGCHGRQQADTGPHWRDPSLLRHCQDAAWKRKVNHLPFCPQHCLRAVPTLNYPQAR